MIVDYLEPAAVGGAKKTDIAIPIHEAVCRVVISVQTIRHDLPIPKLSVSHSDFIKNYYNKCGLCHLATSKWKTRWDCRAYRIYGVRYLPA